MTVIKWERVLVWLSWQLAYLLFGFLLHLLQVGSQVHSHLMFSTQ